MSEHKINRRHFLQRNVVAASGASLAPWLAGCASQGGEPRPKQRKPERPPVVPPSEQITLGLIGMGIRNRNMLRRYFLKDPRVRILAIAEVDQKRRNHYKGEVNKAYDNKNCDAYVDYREILGRRDIDAVVIATPDHWHATQCIEAAKAGKDIYCDKPLTHTLLEGQRIVEAVQKYGRVFQTGSQQRSEFKHRFVRAVEYVRAGRIGKLLAVHVGVGDPAYACDLGEEEIEPGLDWDRWLGPTAQRPFHSVLSPRGVHKHYPKWRRYWDYCGGMLADMGAHHFDIVQWALDADAGGPVAALPPPRENAKRGATLVYENGVRVVHGGPSGATFLGTHGMIHVDRGRLMSVPDKILKDPLTGKDPNLPRNKSHADDWIRCIKSRGTPICSAEIGARSAAVNQLLNLAYRHQRKISWDPIAWKFAGDEPASWMDYERRSEYALPEIS